MSKSDRFGQTWCNHKFLKNLPQKPVLGFGYPHCHINLHMCLVTGSECMPGKSSLKLISSSDKSQSKSCLPISSIVESVNEDSEISFSGVGFSGVIACMGS